MRTRIYKILALVSLTLLPLLFAGCANSPEGLKGQSVAADGPLPGEYGTILAAADKIGLVYIGAKGSECNILIVQDCKLYGLTNVDVQIYCAGRSQGKDTLFRADIQQQNLAAVTDLPDSRGTVMLRPGPDHTVLYGYYDAVYQYDLETGEGRDIYAWANAGMNGRNMSSFFMDDLGALWVVPKLLTGIWDQHRQYPQGWRMGLY